MWNERKRTNSVGHLISEIMKNQEDENKLNELRTKLEILPRISTIWLKQESI